MFKKESSEIVLQISDVASGSSRQGDYEELEPVIGATGRVSHLQELQEMPQGRHLGLFSIIVLFVSRIVGSGIFSISSGIYVDCGQDPFLFFLCWMIATILAFSGLYVYLELGSLIPRSGGTKVFLEFIYEKPALLATVCFGFYSIILGFTVTNCIVFGEYFLNSLGFHPNEFQSRATGLVYLYIVAGIHGVSVSYGIKVQNVFGFLKLLLILIMLMTSIYSVFFPSSITGIESNLHWDQLFHSERTFSIPKFASGALKASFAFSGWNSVHTVSSEVRDPVRTFKIAGPISLIIISVVYFLTNVAYLKVIPGSEISDAGTLVGSLYFEKIFGYRLGKQLLTFAVALSVGGNIFVVVYTISRTSQEVFRDGYLPFSELMASNWPFGAPLPTLLLSVTLSTLVLAISMDKDIFNYLVALEGYSQQIFTLLVAIGIFIIRNRHPGLRAPIRSGIFGTGLVIAISMYLLISPLVSSSSPNPKGMESWLSYPLVTLIGCIIAMSYWYLRFRLFPWYFGYDLIQEEYKLDDGLIMKRLVRAARDSI